MRTTPPPLREGRRAQALYCASPATGRADLINGACLSSKRRNRAIAPYGPAGCHRPGSTSTLGLPGSVVLETVVDGTGANSTSHLRFLATSRKRCSVNELK